MHPHAVIKLLFHRVSLRIPWHFLENQVEMSLHSKPFRMGRDNNFLNHLNRLEWHKPGTGFTHRFFWKTEIQRCLRYFLIKFWLGLDICISDQWNWAVGTFFFHRCIFSSLQGCQQVKAKQRSFWQFHYQSTGPVFFFISISIFFFFFFLVFNFPKRRREPAAKHRVGPTSYFHVGFNQIQWLIRTS